MEVHGVFPANDSIGIIMQTKRETVQGMFPQGYYMMVKFTFTPFSDEQFKMLVAYGQVNGMMVQVEVGELYSKKPLCELNTLCPQELWDIFNG